MNDVRAKPRWYYCPSCFSRWPSFAEQRSCFNTCCERYNIPMYLEGAEQLELAFVPGRAGLGFYTDAVLPALDRNWV